MQLEKELIKKEEGISTYEDIFSKKTEPEVSTEIKSPEDILEKNILKNKIKEKYLYLKNLKFKARNLNVKHVVIALLLGIIANISIYHNKTIALEANSQKLVNGLIYNLSETNDLQQIASNIYLGMKENGWEPTIKLSNANAFIFQLDKGAEFTIIKNVNVVSTKFHVNVANFSNEMIRALKIQLEPGKIGGTKNFITNKEYDMKTNSISFDIEKVGSGSMDMTMPLNMSNLSPLVNQLPQILNSENQIDKNLNLSKEENKVSKNIDSKIISIPISPELEGKINKNQNQNTNSNPTIQKNK